LQQSRLLQTALVAGVLTLLCIFVIDQPFARWLATRETWPPLWDEGIRILEYPLGIEPYKWAGVWVLVVGSIVTLAVPRLQAAAFAFTLVTLVHLTGRILMLWLKFAFGRRRPSQWLEAGGDTFWHDNAWSFPSGHVILFASIVVPIAVVYPRMRPLLAIAVFAMTARVMVSAHFVSDVLAGYALIALLTWAYARLLQRALPSSKQPASLR
jgi:undecaprenyl-diphosphatase